MMEISIKINNRTIGRIGVHNTGEKGNSGTLYDVYDVYPSGDIETLNDAEKIGSVEHRRQSGAAVLTKKVMNEVVEEKHLT